MFVGIRRASGAWAMDSMVEENGSVSSGQQDPLAQSPEPPNSSSSALPIVASVQQQNNSTQQHHLVAATNIVHLTLPHNQTQAQVEIDPMVQSH